MVGYLCDALLVAVASADILQQFLRRKADEVQAWRARVVAAADAERRRIERDLHDGTQQHLTSVAVKLLLAAQRAGQDPALASLLAEIGAEVRDTAEELRGLTHGIYPPLLREQGLASALSTAASHSPLPTRVQAGSLGRYPADIEAAVYFCCLEAMQNACKHAGERATIWLRVREEPATLALEVTDDGAGFDAADRGLGAGFLNMADRLGAFGGHLCVDSAPGQGTRVTGMVPVNAGSARLSAPPASSSVFQERVPPRRPACASKGTRAWAFGLPQPVTGSQPGPA
jgi:signal transduction histidine kinase